jgi:hypothetical protein
MNIELDDGLIRLLERYDEAQESPCVGDQINRLSQLIALRVATKWQAKNIARKAAQGTEHEDMECLK